MMYAAPQAIVQPVCRQLNKKPQKTRKKSMPQLPKECLMCLTLEKVDTKVNLR